MQFGDFRRNLGQAGGAWEVRAKAVDKGGKPVVSPVGTVSGDGCHIKWSERWAPWRKQAPEAAPTPGAPKHASGLSSEAP